MKAQIRNYNSMSPYNVSMVQSLSLDTKMGHQKYQSRLIKQNYLIQFTIIFYPTILSNSIGKNQSTRFVRPFRLTIETLSTECLDSLCDCLCLNNTITYLHNENNFAWTNQILFSTQKSLFLLHNSPDTP